VNVYSIDIKICATAYIKAETEEQAMEIAKREFVENSGMELPDNLDWLEMPITGMDYDSPDLPAVSLSPAMTFHGLFDETTTPDIAAEDVPEIEEEDE
jgi:hypothetical protein